MRVDSSGEARSSRHRFCCKQRLYVRVHAKILNTAYREGELQVPGVAFLMHVWYSGSRFPAAYIPDSRGVT